MRQVWFTTSGWLKTPGVLLGDPTTKSVPMPTVVAVCEREDGDIWLVDAGWGAEACEDPSSMGPIGKRMFGTHLRPGDDIASKMRRAGLDPARVTTVIATHLHLDHVGGVHDFPNAELVATHSEMSEAIRRVWDMGYRRADIERIERLRLVYLERNPVMGITQTRALSDDVTLLGTPGHTTGHIAVLIKQKNRLWIHGGDVAYVHRELRRRMVSPLMRLEAHDPKLARQSQLWLRACETQQPRPTLVLAHDGTRLASLPSLAGERLEPPTSS